MRSLFLALVPFIACAFSAPTSNTETHVLHEKRSDNPITWHKTAPAASHDLLHLKIALKQQNLEHIDTFLHAVSHPDSPGYGQHWTSEQVANTFAPSKETVHGVVKWLTDSGIHLNRLQSEPGRHWIEFNATIAEAEELLKTKYHVFENSETGGQRVACDAYSLPRHVQEHVDLVMPTVQLDGLRPAKVIQTAADVNQPVPLVASLTSLEHCGGVFSINCMRALYNFGPSNHSFANNMMGIPEWKSYSNRSDLALFFHYFTLPPQVPDDTRPTFVSINDGKTAETPPIDPTGQTETFLDLSTAYSIIYPQTINYYEVDTVPVMKPAMPVEVEDPVGLTSTIDSHDVFNPFLDALHGSYCSYLGGDPPYVNRTSQGHVQCGGAPKSSVISVSWGQYEAGLSEFYQRRQCQEWGKLGLQGVTVVFSSGDTGVASRYDSTDGICLDAKLGTPNPSGTRFSPGFPASCPHVTSVGGTQLKTANLGDGEEVMNWPSLRDPSLRIISGGGFSGIFERPPWQDTAIKTYLENYVPSYDASVYNKSGRGFPDVAAMGAGLLLILNGTFTTGGGTSASAPIFASLINLLNGERIAAGKPTIGYLNHVLYANPQMFNDVTEGSNPGCGTDGFSAAPGWDPVTGLGTPNYEKMKEVFMSLP